MKLKIITGATTVMSGTVDKLLMRPKLLVERAGVRSINGTELDEVDA
jgi:hypothetical protein